MSEINAILIAVSLKFSNDPKIRCENCRTVVSRPRGTGGPEAGVTIIWEMIKTKYD